jgi:shikimate dehydrogenase
MLIGLLGHQIDYSLSPFIYDYWFNEYNFDSSYSYQLIDQHPQELEHYWPMIMGSEEDFCLNVTIPYKNKIFSKISSYLPHESDGIVQKIEAINCIKKYKNNILATNSDYLALGFLLQSLMTENHKKAVIIGRGGLARATICALNDRNIHDITLINRYAGADRLDKLLGIPIKVDTSIDEIKQADIVINTTPIGSNNLSFLPPLPMVHSNTIIVECVYKPFETPLVKFAQSKKIPLITGLDLLLYQACFAFDFFFGKRPIVDSKLYNTMKKYCEK